MSKVVYGPYYRTRSSSMPREDVYGETDTHFYFGWTAHNGGWLIRRQARATGVTGNATITNNTLYSVLSSAWANRETLIFEVKNDN